MLLNALLKYMQTVSTLQQLIFGHVECKLSDIFTLNLPAVTRGHMYKLFKHQSKNSVRQSFVTERVVNISNFLPVGIVNFSSFQVLKELYSTLIFLVCYKYFNRLKLL